MRELACSEERFLKDVASHEMTVLREDGVYRHIQFKRPDSGCFRFDFITWPGYLCYTGDMGTYVFCRTNDMFAFFRTDREYMTHREGRSLAINHSYWAGKVQSDSRYGKGTEAFSEELFREAIKHDFDQHFANIEPDDDASEQDKSAFQELKAETWEAVEDEILSVDSLESQGVSAAYDFAHGALAFQDFCDHRLTDYTFHFIWCCYALAWGIQKYDEAKVSQAQDGVRGVALGGEMRDA